VTVTAVSKQVITFNDSVAQLPLDHTTYITQYILRKVVKQHLLGEAGNLMTFCSKLSAAGVSL